MTSLVDIFLNHQAQRRLGRHCETRIDPTARVNYRGIGGHQARLSIGAKSLFEGRIAFDRDGAEVRIGARTYIGSSLIVCADRVEIGDDVLVSWGCSILDHDSHALDWDRRSQDVTDWYHGRKDWSKVRIRPIRIGHRVWVGFNVAILCGVTVGEGAVIGGCSVVTRDVEPYTLVAGNPARLIRHLKHA